MVTLSPMRGMIGGSGAPDFFWDFAIIQPSVSKGCFHFSGPGTL